MRLGQINKKYLDTIILVFLGISFITSGLSIAMSSYGVGGVIILLTLKIILDRGLHVEAKTVLYILAFFTLWQIFTSLLSNDPPTALTDTLKKVSLYSVFICAISVVSYKDQLKKLLLALFLFTAILSFYESVRYIIDYNAQNAISLPEFRLSYFGHPLTLGEIKMLVLLVMIPFILAKEDFVLSKWALAVSAFPILLSLYFTNSRNAILGLFAGVLVIGLARHRYFLIGFITAVTIFLYLAPMQVKERILSIADLEHPSNKSRIIMWEVGIKMIKDKPLIGYGDVDILSIYKKYKEPQYIAE